MKNIEWTPELLREFAKCSTDIKYFAEKYIKIMDMKLGSINIKLNEFQLSVVDEFVRSKKFVKHNKRQSGKTTIAAIILLHAAIFEEHKVIFMVGCNNSGGIEMLGRVKRMFAELPEFLQPEIKTNNKDSFGFDNGSIIYSSGPNSDRMRGMTVSYLYIDESEFMSNIDEFVCNIIPIISSMTYGKVFALTSTRTGEALGY